MITISAAAQTTPAQSTPTPAAKPAQAAPAGQTQVPFLPQGSQAPSQFAAKPQNKDMSPEELAKQDWATPAEKSGYKTTPNYDDTMAYIDRIQKAVPSMVRVQPFGRTGEGRTMNVVVVSKDGVFDSASIHKAKRPILLVQNSIHAGEMDGKDACLELLRDMVITRKQADLLDKAVFVFIPVYNIDGHERRGAYNRINQNGPEEAGWRGNGTNLNLNRDYMKAEAPETKAFLRLVHQWLPDFFVDNHVTDGADFQYDVTFTLHDTQDVPADMRGWMKDTVGPEIAKYVDDHGHVAFPTYVNLVDDSDLSKGLAFNEDQPRFSTGYMTLENVPSMLVELHMIKDYKTRVTANYETMVALLKILNRDSDKLLTMKQAWDDAAAKLSTTKQPYLLSVAWDGKTTTPVEFKGYKYTRDKSDISGSTWVKYDSSVPQNYTLPMQTGEQVTASTVPPAGYIIPLPWLPVIMNLVTHGVQVKPTSADWTGTITTYDCSGMTWQEPPFEGHHPLFNGEAAPSQAGKYGQCKPVERKVTYPKGSAVVDLNQRLSAVAIQWLEPIAPDSALRWNLLDSIFEQKEYGENYVVEKLARDMMAKDPALKSEFEQKLKSDPEFKKSPEARLRFFYDRSPYYAANRVGEYPIGRLATLDGIPMQQQGRPGGAMTRPMQPGLPAGAARPMTPAPGAATTPQAATPAAAPAQPATSPSPTK